jgi:hypothetical protein
LRSGGGERPAAGRRRAEQSDERAPPHCFPPCEKIRPMEYITVDGDVPKRPRDRAERATR